MRDVERNSQLTVTPRRNDSIVFMQINLLHQLLVTAIIRYYVQSIILPTISSEHGALQAIIKKCSVDNLSIISISVFDLDIVGQLIPLSSQVLTIQFP